MGFSGERQADHNRKVRWSNEQRASGRMKKGIHLDNPRPNEEWPTALIIAPSSVCEKCGPAARRSAPPSLADTRGFLSSQLGPRARDCTPNCLLKPASSLY
jgi:hypothetical protein